MWVKLGSEHLNLDHVVRVRFNKGWKNGVEEWVAELEAFVKGDLQVFARYRNREADILLAALQGQGIAIEVPVPVPSRDGAPLPAVSASSPSTNTLYDM